MASLQNVTAPELPFRHLWVGGRRVPRVQSKGETVKMTPTAAGYSGEGFLSGPAATWPSVQAEMRWPSQVKNWIEPRCIVSAVNDTLITVDPSCWSALVSRNGGKPAPVPAWVENTGEVPTSGTFLATNQAIFFRPFRGTTGPPVDAWTSSAEALLVGHGLVNHTLQSLSFQHATWRIVERDGYVPTQTAVTPQGEPPAAVRFSAARGLLVDDCQFEHIGAPYAFEASNRTHGANVTRSRFSDLSGGAVKLGNVNNTRAPSRDPADADTGFFLNGSTVSGVALEYRGAAAVFAGYVADTTISHNDISRTGYTGISLGWGWGTFVQTGTFARNNHIVANRLTGIMQSLNDGGCTYTLGPQPSSTVHNNYCVNDAAPVVGCFYHDNGSRYFNTTGNICMGSPAPCVYLQGCCNAPAYDIYVADTWCRATKPVDNGCAAENCVVDNATVHYLTAFQPFPPAAKVIIAAAGLD